MHHMKSNMWIISIWMILNTVVLATDRYVALNGTNDAGSGYTNWAGAATNIQDAVAVATNSETVWVTNGTYYIRVPTIRIVSGTTNWSGVMITNAITLRSVNGATNTIIDGNRGVTTGRCIFVKGGGVVDGFTLTHGYAFAPGYAGESTKGGGVYISAGEGNGTVRNCIIIANESVSDGGGVDIYNSSGSLVENCIISCNTNGGIRLSYANGSIVRNCLITKNMPRGSSAYGGIAMLDGAVQNCTIVSNYIATGAGSGVYIQDSPSYPYASLSNNIIYYNTSTSGVDNYWGTNALFANNCTYPTITTGRVGSANNITNEPSFKDMNNANYRLGENSPCINTGTNQSWMTTGVDLDGRQRIRYGIVDMGAYEYIRPAGTIFIVH